MAIAAPVAALTEARIVDVDCTGLTVVQTGLPGRTLFRVEALDAATAHDLRVKETRSSADGRLSVRLNASIHGVHRLHAEVYRVGDAETEYGEADVDVDDNCRVTGTQPAPRPSATATAAAPAPASRGGSSGSTSGYVLLGALAVAVAGVSGALMWRTRRARPVHPA